MNKTIDYYNKNAEKFKKDTINVEFESRQDMLLKYLEKGDNILDLGCGAGRDSKAFLEKGYGVTSIDGSKELCNIARKYIGRDVRCLNFEDLDYKEEFKGVWACASLLHVEKNKLLKVLEKVSESLVVGGYFYASFKWGEFEGERNGRYFVDFTEDTFRKFIEKKIVLEIIEVEITGDARIGREEEKWFNVILRKME